MQSKNHTTNRSNWPKSRCAVASLAHIFAQYSVFNRAARTKNHKLSTNTPKRKNNAILPRKKFRNQWVRARAGRIPPKYIYYYTLSHLSVINFSHETLRPLDDFITRHTHTHTPIQEPLQTATHEIIIRQSTQNDCVLIARGRRVARFCADCQRTNTDRVLAIAQPQALRLVLMETAKKTARYLTVLRSAAAKVVF